jgi:hypothetical protein
MRLVPYALPFAILAPALVAQVPQAAIHLDADALSGLRARNIGPAVMSGRISAIDGIMDKGRLTLFVGAASGGVWKSANAGTTWKSVFDKHIQSIGAIRVDPSNPKTIWVGTGESWMRNSVSVGDGIYKTTDGGETWTNMGLPNSEHISQIVVDPTNGDVVYACVPGRLWSDSADRGLYKTTDGGKTWAQIIKAPNLSTGCSTIAMDPKNPRKLFAGLWDFRRTIVDLIADAHYGTMASELHKKGMGLYAEAPGVSTEIIEDTLLAKSKVEG